ncbi:MAG: DUF2272 domain-containing protein [Alphaproteobacteria bacterium]|nr:DUF2272 domain-containing protein [Alphaproteobacteria bacterium]
MNQQPIGCLVALALALQLCPASATPRLPLDVLDVSPPSDRVSGPRSYMHVTDTHCRIDATVNARRRIVDIAVQEWAFFGAHTVDLSHTTGNALPTRLGVIHQGAESVAPTDPTTDTTVAGYWSTTPDGASIIARQNAYWYAAGVRPIRWVYPWSAAFISWVMCEGGLGDPRQFQRSIAHRDYIDQAIRGRDTSDRYAAYYAYDLGEQLIEPGDLLCDVLESARFRYRSIADRRNDMGMPAPAHCDLVVKVAADRMLVIGGNILGAVTLAIWPTQRDPGLYMRPVRSLEIDGHRAIFAHLKLRASPIEANAMDNSPTIKPPAVATNTGPGAPVPALATAPNDGAAVQLPPNAPDNSAITQAPTSVTTSPPPDTAGKTPLAQPPTNSTDNSEADKPPDTAISH